MTEQDINLATFFFAMLSVVGLWALFNFYINQTRLWQASVLFAMALIGLGGIALFIPELKPYNGLTRVVGVAGMVIGAFVSGYLGSANEFTVTTRRSSLWALGVGVLGLILLMPVLYLFQRQGDQVASQTATLQDVKAEVQELRQETAAVKQLNLQLNARLNAQDTARNQREAAFQKQVLKNQKKGLQNQADVKLKLQQSPPQRSIIVTRGRNQ